MNTPLEVDKAVRLIPVIATTSPNVIFLSSTDNTLVFKVVVVPLTVKFPATVKLLLNVAAPLNDAVLLNVAAPLIAAVPPTVILLLIAAVPPTAILLLNVASGFVNLLLINAVKYEFAESNSFFVVILL